jgi:hypothetical protein
MGDLEIALATSFTLAGLCFVLALNALSDARHYAILAGLILGVGLWTKPTMGAFVWGVALVVVWTGAAALRTHMLHDGSSAASRSARAVHAWQRVMRTGLVVAAAAAPLGGIWYVRNLLLGHNAVDFPPAFWLTQAMRSGAEFGWPLLGLLLLLAYLFFGPVVRRPRLWPTLTGLLLILISLLPSIFEPRRMTVWEGLLLAAGVLIVGWFIMRRPAGTISSPYMTDPSPTVRSIGLLTLLSLPYFFTWFWSYSYHYRLSFAIAPLLLLPTALIAARWTGEIAQVHARTTRRSPRSVLLSVVIIALAVPGIVVPLYDPYTGWDSLFTDAYPDDTARQRSGNRALLNLVDGLQAYLDVQTAPLVVVAPGVQTLPFFFPTQDIRTRQAPIRLAELEGVTYFVDSHPQGTGAYQDVPLLANQVWGALRRDDIMRYAWGLDDGIFRYAVYELHLDRRWQRPQPVDYEIQAVTFDEFASFLGSDLGGLEFWVGRPVMLTLYFEALQPAALDYSLFVHLRDRTGQVVANWDGPVALNPDTNPPRYYSTRMWQPGEYVREARTLRLESLDAPLGEGYALVIGFYDPTTQQRVPVYIQGVLAGDDYTIEDRIALVTPPP